MKRTLLLFVTACAIALPAAASQAVQQWFMGHWTCTIDGRPSRMSWRIVNDPTTSCEGDTCSSAETVTYAGSFQDGSGPWVPLTYLGSNTTMIRMRHPDGNEWYLARQDRGARGWTTWSGRRYPLICRRPTDIDWTTIQPQIPRP